MRWFYSIWLLFSTVSAASALLVAGYFYRIRATFGDTSRLVRYLILAFLGVGVESLLSRLPVDLWFRFAGRTFEMLTVGALALFCLRYVNGKQRGE